MPWYGPGAPDAAGTHASQHNADRRLYVEENGLAMTYIILPLGCPSPTIGRLSSADHARGVSVPRIRVDVVSREAVSPQTIRMRQPLSRAVPRPPLLSHVSGIICCCPNEQMLRVAARRVVAAVTDEHAHRDRTVCKFPRHTVSVLRPRPPVGVHSKCSVPAWLPWSQPLPASIPSAVYLRPESNDSVHDPQCTSFSIARRVRRVK